MKTILTALLPSLGHGETTGLLILVILSLVCRLVTKLIPDNATGTLGVIRRITQVIGLYVADRIAPGVTVNEATKVSCEVAEKVERVESKLEDASVIVRGAKGHFKKSQKK